MINRPLLNLGLLHKGLSWRRMVGRRANVWWPVSNGVMAINEWIPTNDIRGYQQAWAHVPTRKYCGRWGCTFGIWDRFEYISRACLCLAPVECPRRAYRAARVDLGTVSSDRVPSASWDSSCEDRSIRKSSILPLSWHLFYNVLEILNATRDARANTMPVQVNDCADSTIATVFMCSHKPDW